MRSIVFKLGIHVDKKLKKYKYHLMFVRPGVDFQATTGMINTCVFIEIEREISQRRSK